MTMHPCAICRLDKQTALESAELGLYRCGSCGHVFKSASGKSNEKYGEEYFTKEHKNWFANLDYPLFEFIRAEIVRLKGDKGIKVLDIGCGKGDLLKYLKARDSRLELYGIDLSANRHPDINFVQGDILKLDLGVKFDVVCSIASIEHVDSPLEFACRIKDLLLPGGIAFIVTDNDDGMIYAAARLLRKVGIRAPYDRLYMAHHLQCFSRKSLRMLVENCGLRVISHKDHNHPVAAVDYPDADIILKAIYAAAVRIIFGLSGLFRTGILQVVVCRKD